MRIGPTVLLVVVLMAGCAGGDATTDVPDAPAAATGELPSLGAEQSPPPATVDGVQEALAALSAMPDDLAGWQRTASDGITSYADGDAADDVATIEAMEVTDMLAPGQQREALLDELRAMVSDAVACGPGLALCVRGTGPDGRPATLWSSTDGEVVMAAVAATEDDLAHLLTAWDESVASLD